MATMTIRTTVAFDLPTASRLERLAKRWGLSKSETLRRSLEDAERQALAAGPPTAGGEPDFSAMTPLEIMDWLEAHPLLPAGTGKKWSAEIRRERHEEAARWEQRGKSATAPRRRRRKT